MKMKFKIIKTFSFFDMIWRRGEVDFKEGICCHLVKKNQLSDIHAWVPSLGSVQEVDQDCGTIWRDDPGAVTDVCKEYIN